MAETDKYTKVADGHFFTAKQTKEVQIKMRDNNGKPFIDMLYNVLFAPYLCDRLFTIITLMNSGYTRLFYKVFCKILLINNEKNEVTLPHIAHQKYAFLVKTKESSKPQKEIPKKKVSLELLHQRLEHRYTSSLLARYTTNVWKEIELSLDPDPL